MYEIGTITYSVSPIYKLEKGGQGAHDIKHSPGDHADRNIKDSIDWHTRSKIVQ